MSIDLKQADMVITVPGVSFVFVTSTIFVMFVAAIFAGKLLSDLSQSRSITACMLEMSLFAYKHTFQA